MDLLLTTARQKRNDRARGREAVFFNELFASDCCANRFGSTSRGFASSGTSSESARLCAGSVLITIVRKPLRAQASAVAVATLVLPTPPLPVYKIVRGVTRGIISCRYL